MPDSRSARSMNDAIAVVIEQDPDIRDDIRDLVKSTIKYAKHTLKFGSQADKAALMRSVVPAMMRALEHNEQGETERKRGEAYARIKAAMAEGIGEQDAAPPAD